jgi:7,8-dihydroneopterin aldolase/epimerase/oxygenase
MLLKIKNLRLKTNLGVYDWEKTFDREIIVNLEIETDFLDSLTSDNLEDAIDYDAISQKVKNFITINKFGLIEKMAKDLLDEILQDKRIKRCKLEIDKVGSIDFVESASITLEKERTNGS